LVICRFSTIAGCRAGSSHAIFTALLSAGSVVVTSSVNVAVAVTTVVVTDVMVSILMRYEYCSFPTTDLYALWVERTHLSTVNVVVVTAVPLVVVLVTVEAVAVKVLKL